MFRKLATATVLATTALAGLAPAIAHANTANPAPEPASEAGGCRFGRWPAADSEQTAHRLQVGSSGPTGGRAPSWRLRLRGRRLRHPLTRYSASHT